MLPFKQAIKLPFDFYRHVRFENLCGKVIINTPHIHRAMIKIGGRGSEMFPHLPAIIDIKGTLIFNGIVEIGNGCLICVESQVFDTNFHYMKDINTERALKKTSPIIIGSYNWFGNRVNIMKGTITSDRTIVASNSLVNKDYTNMPAYSTLAGTPAKFVKSGIKRMFEGVDL